MLPCVYYLSTVPSVLTSQLIPSSPPTSAPSKHGNGHTKSSTFWLYKPPFYVDEIGLTSDKYIPLNATVCSLPLKVSISEFSLQRWLLLAHMERSFSEQSNLGFSATDIDDVRRLVADTSLYFLSLTMLAALLHLLFETLAFESDISFWNSNKSMVGLSARALVIDLFSQVVIFLFLVDSDTSLLVSVPSFVAILIQCWKVRHFLCTLIMPYIILCRDVFCR